MEIRRLRFLWLMPLLAASPLFAQDEGRLVTQTRVAKQSVTSTGDRGLFTVPSVETLNRGQYSFGGAWSNTARTPKALNINSFPVHVSYGISERLTVTGTVETEKQVLAHVLDQPGFYNQLPLVNQRFQSGLGDVFLGAKYRLQRRSDNIGGIALRGFVKLPTADSRAGLGTGATDVGADLIFTSLLPWRFLMHSNIGYTATRDTRSPAFVGIKDELRSGFGAAWPSTAISLNPVPSTVRGSAQFIFEYSSLSFVGAGTANTAVQSPIDITTGIRYFMLDRGITVDAGYRVNSHFDLSFPGNLRSYRNGFTVSLSYTKPVTPPSINNHAPAVALEAAPLDIAAGQSTQITATGFDADNDPLTYIWSASAGRITGSGENVRFDSTGLPPGKYVVRVTAADGRTGIANSEIEITVH
jgi:hypothetical protein